MKKIIPFLLITLFISFPILTFANEQNIYPIYYGTKKCEIDTRKETKQPPSFYDKEDYSFYIENNNLYKNDKIYKTWVNYLYMEYEDNVLYGIQNGKNIALYKNDEKVLSPQYINDRSAFYNIYTKQYMIGVTLNKKNFMLVNDKLIPSNEFEFHERYFSQNKKFFVDVYSDNGLVKVVKDNKIVFEKLPYIYITDVKVSNDGSDFALKYLDGATSNRNWVRNGKEIIEHLYDFEYSPSGKDFYYVTHNGTQSFFSFYKNNEKLFDFDGVIYNSIFYNFTSEEDYSFIVTNRANYALIENGKIRISYDDTLQIKSITKKANGDIFIVKKNKILWIDTLEINGKEVLRAKDIDERYIDNGADTFSLFSNKYTNSSEYSTFINTENNEYYLLVNNFIIDDFYDYLHIEQWLNIFNFYSKGSKKILCQDINYLFPNIKYSREELEKMILKILELSPEKSLLLENKLKNLLSWNALKEKDKEILQMFLDNLKNKSLQIYAK